MVEQVLASTCHTSPLVFTTSPQSIRLCGGMMKRDRSAANKTTFLGGPIHKVPSSYLREPFQTKSVRVPGEVTW